MSPSRQRERAAAFLSWLAPSLLLLIAGACTSPGDLDYKVSDQTVVLAYVADPDTKGRPIGRFLDDELKRCQRRWTRYPIVWSISETQLLGKPSRNSPDAAFGTGTSAEVAFSDPNSGQIVYRFKVVQLAAKSGALMITRASSFEHPQLPPLPSRDNLIAGTKAWATNLSKGKTGCHGTG